MNKHLAAAMAAFVVAGVSGCAVFTPYDSEFQCERSRDFGKCTNVEGAYSDALGGEAPVTGPAPGSSVAHAQRDESYGPRDARRGVEAKPAPKAEPGAVQQPEARININRYKAAEYGELASIIEQPVTPVVAPPKTLRTLVVAYATPEKTLYLPRYVYYFVSEGEFVLGDYLNADQPDRSAVMYPNGAP